MRAARRAAAVALLLAVPAAVAMAGNFAQCILKRMPGAVNSAYSTAAWQSCRAEFPGGYAVIRQGAARGLLAPADGHACTLKHAANTTWPMASAAIAHACRCLYDAPEHDGFSPADAPHCE